MVFNVHEFAGAFRLDGARPALFQIDVTNPSLGAADAIFPFMAKAGSIPASTLTTIEVPYMGRKIKVPGTRTFAEWSVTIINDEDFPIRNALETWTNMINSFQGNLRTFPTSAPSEYKSVAKVTQLGKTGDVLRVYEFFGIWPSEVGAIALAFETDAIEEFPVTFQYDYWEVVEGITGNAGGN